MARRMTTAELLTELKEELRELLTQRDRGIEARLSQLAEKVDRLEATVEKGFSQEAKAGSCPYRVEIAQAVNNHRAVQELCGEMTKVRIELARLGIGGGIVGAMTLLGIVTGKILGLL